MTSGFFNSRATCMPKCSAVVDSPCVVMHRPVFYNHTRTANTPPSTADTTTRPLPALAAVAAAVMVMTPLEKLEPHGPNAVAQ